MPGSTVDPGPAYVGRRSKFFDVAITPPAHDSPPRERSTSSTRTSNGARISRHHSHDSGDPRRPGTPLSLCSERGRTSSVASSSDASSVRSMAQHIGNQYLSNVPQQSPIYDAIAVVASLATRGARGREASSDELAASITRVCSSMNQDALTGGADGQRTLPAVMESIAAMAIDGLFSGHQQHWHILMKGLRDIHDRAGGLSPDWGDTLNKIRKADVKGAVCTGTTPYLEFDKYFPSVSDSLPAQVRAEVTSNMRSCLQASSISRLNVDSFQALALFTQTVVRARQLASEGSSLAFDVQGFAEDCLRVEYQVIRYPRSLREDIAQADRVFSASGISESAHDGQTTRPSATTSTAVDAETNLLNAVLRSAALLYIEDLLPDARSIDLCTILLSALTHQIGNIVLAMSHRLKASAPAPGLDRILPRLDLMRPVLLWSCMVGYGLTQFINQTRSAQLDCTPFEQCVGQLLLGSGTSVRGLSARDMQLSELLPVRAIRSVSCDEGTLLRRMVAGYEASQLRRRRP